MSTKNHNLNIHMYNFQELLDLFNLQHNFSLAELKQAKKVVLRTHPDKSKLPSEYFLFYKKAFEVVVNYYENNHKQNTAVPDKKIIYETNNSHYDDETNKRVSNVINNMNAKDFNSKFNKIFDKEMVSKIVSNNKFLYPDTCGDANKIGGWPKYHETLLEENSDTNFIIGTYSVHERYPSSNFGRRIKDKKTIVYEYGRGTIMKTYISINKQIFDKMLEIFMMKNKKKCNEIKTIRFIS